MSLLAVSGSQMQCSAGTLPATLTATPRAATAQGSAVATVMDFEPMVNIPPFGLCTSEENPQVSAMEGAPQPCMPMTQPWSEGAAALQSMGLQPLTIASKCQCNWGGQISILDTLQTAADTAA